MDIEDWELVPVDGYLEIQDDGVNSFYSRKYGGRKSPRDIFDGDYFLCPSPDEEQEVSSFPPPQPKRIIPLHVQLDQPDTQAAKRVPIGIAEEKAPAAAPAVIMRSVENSSQVFFKKMEENEFVDMKVDSPRSSSINRGIQIQPQPQPQIEAASFQFEERREVGGGGDGVVEEGKPGDDDGDDYLEREKMVGKGGGVGWVVSNEEGMNRVWKWSLGGIGAICSFGMAAATVCIIIFGNGHRNNHHNHDQKLRFQIYSDDKATRLNGAIAGVRGVPLTKAHITYGGYCNAL